MSIGLTKEAKRTSNPTVYNRARRRELSCPLCPPNRGENKRLHKKHGVQKSMKHRRKKL